MSKLPIAIIIPHASLEAPPELRGVHGLTPEQIFNEADAYVDQIFDFRDRVHTWLSFPYARSLIDVNRPNDEISSKRAGLWRPGDGIVKARTSYGAPVYAPGLEPDARLTEQLINRYWRDWHRQLDAIAADSSIKFVLDCHSMAAMGPSHYSDPGALRPRAQVANLGDSEGRREPKRDLITASPQIVQRLAHLFGGALRDLPDLAPSDNCCWINAPFWGGWDLWGRGGAQQPWVMFELSRALYIGEQSGDTPLVRPNAYWINQLRERIWGVVESFVTTYL